MDFKKGTLVKIVYQGIVKKGKRKYLNFDVYKGE